MSNEYKRATGYYTLRILRVSGTGPNVKDLYVKVEVKNTTQRTQVIHDESTPWNETLPIRVPTGKTIVSFTLSRRLRALPFNRSIGFKELSMAELVELNKAKEETLLELPDPSRNVFRHLTIKLDFSDVKENATVSLVNLLALTNDNDEIPLDSKLQAADEKVEQVMKQGKAVMQSKLSKTVRKAIPQIDSFVDTVDNIVQAHPLLNVGWQLVAAAYKTEVISEQIRLDGRVNNLLRSAAIAFSFAQDASLLSEGDDRLSSLRRTIIQLLDQLIECSLFVREYARQNIFKRISSQASDKRKVQNIEYALRALQENLERGVNFQIGFFIKDVAGAVQLRARDETLREIRLAFDLTPVMLHDMESSSHQQCMASTRTEWIAEIVAWTKSDSAQIIFWINGIPGSGKSTIAQTIAQHPDILLMLISHIVFKRENTRRHDILKLIAYRLAERNAKIAEEIASRLHKRTPTLRDTFINLILEPLKAAESAGLLLEPIIIVLDALDEYGTSESRTQLMQLFANEFAELPRHVRFLITSRPEADLVRALSSKTHIKEGKLDVHTEESRRDVSIFIETELKKLVSEQSSIGPGWDEMMLKLGTAADGLFIWAAVAIRLVKNAQRPYKKICTLAGDESHLTLDELYRQALEAIDVNWEDPDVTELFATLFALILPNRGALTIELFDLLLGFEGDSSELLLFKLQSFISSGKFRLVQIHHKTFADYLQSPFRVPHEPWYISMSKQNSLIVCHCFTAMEDLHFDMCGAVTHPDGNEVAIGDIQPHILYSCLYWADHLEGAEFSDDVLEFLDSFLSERLLFWFEVLSHLKEFSRVAPQALLCAIKWVSTRSPITSCLLLDANDIISKFPIAISKSPAFIYTSALPLTAQSNKVSAQYLKLLEDPMRIGELSMNHVVEAQSGWLSAPFSGHTDSVASVIFSPDSRFIFSASWDNTIRVWSARTGEAVTAPFLVRSSIVKCIAVSSEGRIIASGSSDGTVRLWDAETGSRISQTIRTQQDQIRSIVFSPTEQRIALAGGEGTILFLDVEQGTTVGKPITGHKGTVFSISYSPDGRRIVSGSRDTTIRIWDTRTNEAVGVPLRGHWSSVNSVTFSPDGLWVASGSDDKTIRIWGALTGAPIGNPLEGHSKTVNAVAYSPDGSRLVSASDDGTVRIWNTKTREVMGDALWRYSSEVRSVAYSQDGSRIVSGGDDGRIIVWNALTGKPIIGTGIKLRDALHMIADDGSNLVPADCQFFAGWKMEGGWVLGAAGERRLWLPVYMRKLVKQVKGGLYVHEDLDLKNCNGAAEGYGGFIVS